MAIQELDSRVTTGGLSTLMASASQRTRRGLTIILRTNSGRIGFAIVLVHLFLALLGPTLAPYSPTEFSQEDLDIRLTGPSVSHPFGTDKFGRDVLSRVMAGARSIIWISVIGTAFGIALGTVAGMTAGYVGGKIDQVIMRVVDVLLAFPSLLLAVVVLYVLEPTVTNLVIVLAITRLPIYLRVTRAEALDVGNPSGALTENATP